MSNADDRGHRPRMSEVVSLVAFRRGAAGRPGVTPDVFFSPDEFNLILNVYGRHVSVGEWRDYAIAHDTDRCVFAVFRRSAEGALYRIVKEPKLARKQGAFSVLGSNGRILKRGHELAQVLRFFAADELEIV